MRRDEWVSWDDIFKISACLFGFVVGVGGGCVVVIWLAEVLLAST